MKFQDSPLTGAFWIIVSIAIAVIMIAFIETCTNATIKVVDCYKNNHCSEYSAFTGPKK